MKSISVYVAGPLFSSGVLTENISEAVCLGAHLDDRARELGLELHCFVPHAVTLTQQLLAPRTHEQAQAWDDHWLRKCDALIYIPGVSAGTDHEVVLALSLGIPVFQIQETGKLLKWAATVLQPAKDRHETPAICVRADCDCV